MQKLVFTCAVLFIFIIPAAGQDISGNDSLREEHAIAYYNQNLQQQQRLYNGVVHTGYSSKIKGNAYFIRDWRTGSVVYDGIHYKDVPLLYDVYKDQVIVQHYNNIFIVGLIGHKVQSFTLPGHRFERIQGSASAAIPEGFYEVLADGELTVLAKHTIKLREYINDMTMEYEFTEHKQYFIRKQGVYHAIRSESKLLELFGDQRTQVKQHLRKSGIKFKTKPKEAIVKAVEYYESLKK